MFPFTPSPNRYHIKNKPPCSVLISQINAHIFDHMPNQIQLHLIKNPIYFFVNKNTRRKRKGNTTPKRLEYFINRFYSGLRRSHKNFAGTPPTT